MYKSCIYNIRQRIFLSFVIVKIAVAKRVQMAIELSYCYTKWRLDFKEEKNHRDEMKDLRCIFENLSKYQLWSVMVAKRPDVSTLVSVESKLIKCPSNNDVVVPPRALYVKRK